MDKPETIPTLPFETARGLELWLQQNHATSQGVWIKFAKKNSGLPSVTYEEAVDLALCFGWIDGQLKSLGPTHHIQRYTPRRPKSIWSKRNTVKVAKLLAEGRMQSAGVAQVEAAKKDGRWAKAYDSPTTMTVPPDFQAALKKNPRAKKFFGTIDATNRYALLYRLQTATSPKIRKARIEKFVTMLDEGKTIHPLTSPRPSEKKPKTG